MPTVLHDSDFQRYRACGDAQAFRRLVEHHLPAVQGTAARLLGSQSGWVDDVAQEVFLILVRKAPHLPPDIVLSAWLHRQTVRRAMDVMRSEGRRHHRETVAELTPVYGEEPGIWEDIAPRLDHELLRLPEQDRQVLALRFMERCSSEEVGRRLGMTSAAVRKRIERALVKLRDRLVGPVPGTLSVSALAIYVGAPSAEAASRASILAISSKCLAASTTGFSAGTLTSLTLMTKTHAITLAAILVVGGGMFFLGRGSGGPAARRTDLGAGAAGGSQDLSSGIEPKTGRSARQSSRRGSDFPTTKEGRVAALNVIMADMNPLARDAAMNDFLAKLTPDEFPELVHSLLDQPPREVSWQFQKTHGSALNAVYAAWAQLDPIAAGKSVDKDAHSSGMLHQLIGSSWAARDPDAAIAWAKSNPKDAVAGDAGGSFLGGVIGGLAGIDPARATAVLQELAPGKENREILEAIAPYVLEQGPDAGLTWIDSFTDERMKDAAISVVAEGLAHTDPRAGVELLIGRLADDASSNGLDGIFKRWSQDESGAAISYVDGMPEGENRRKALNGVIAGLENSGADKSQLVDLVKRHPGDVDATTFSLLSRTVGLADPGFVLDQISRIDDLQVQTENSSDFVLQWYAKDPEGVKKYAADHAGVMPPPLAEALETCIREGLRKESGN